MHVLARELRPRLSMRQLGRRCATFMNLEAQAAPEALLERVCGLKGAPVGHAPIPLQRHPFLCT